LSDRQEGNRNGENVCAMRQWAGASVDTRNNEMKKNLDSGAIPAAIRIVALYVLFSGLWIYFSDTIMGGIIHDPGLMTRLAIYKGFAFIVVTATLLYFLIVRYALSTAENTRLLRESEERFHTIYDSICETVLVVNPVTGGVEDVNRTMTAMYGYSPDEALGMGIQDLSLGEPPFSRKEALDYMQAASRGVPQLFEWRARRKDGRLFWAEVSMRSAPLDGAGRLVLLVRDISERKRLEETLRLTDFSIENMPYAIEWITMDGRFWNVNAAAFEMLGYSREELLSFSVGDIDPHFNLDEWRCHLDELKRTGSMRHARFHKTKDGRVFPVEITSNYLVYGGREYYCAVVRDITDRVQFEKEASFFRALVEFTRDPVYVVDPNDGWRMVYVNQAACSHYGLDRERILTMRIPDWDPAFDMENVDVLWQRMKNGELLRFETLHRVASGKLVPVEVTASYLEHDGRQLSAGYFHDISERKAMESALRESERNLIEAQRIACVGNWARDLQGNLLFASAECRRIFGREAGERPGTFETFLELVRPDDRQLVSTAFADTVRTGQPFLTDFGICRPDGTACEIRARGELVSDASGNPLKVIGTVQDITEQQRAEADRLELERQLLNIQKLESLGILAGGIAHDFNNLLTAILGNLSLMHSDLPTDHPLQDRITRCDKAVQQATGLTCQLLTFSRGGNPVKKLFDLRRVIRDAVSFSLHGSNVAHEMEIHDDLWWIEADEGQIGQVLHNLLINADQAMPHGGILRIEARNQRLSRGQVSSLEPGAYVVVSVIDQGGGIPPENLDKIFDPYFTTKRTGTGLGLTALHSIVRKHGGQVLVSSRVGTGSMFRVYLPACPEQGAGKADAEPASASPEFTGDGYILVMDDEEIIRDMAQEMLASLGYRAEVCSSGEEAIEIYGNALKSGEKPDAVIMDLTIPGMMGGLEAARVILAADPSARLLVSSGYSNDPVMANHRSYGFAEALAKPFRLKDLGATLVRVLGKR
jgi:PAS domain S-box-containing protein